MTAGTFPLPQKPVVVFRQPGIASPKAPLGPTAVRYECNRDGFTARLKLVCSPELGTKIRGPSPSSNHSLRLVQKLGLVNTAADRWMGTSVGIAPAAASKKTITTSPWNGEVSEKTGSGNHSNEFLRAMGGLLAAGVTAWRKKGFGCSQESVYFQSPECQNVNSG